MFRPRRLVSTHRLSPLVIWLAALAWLTVTPVTADPLRLRVGIYENPPKLMADDTGMPSGILGDLLRVVAEREQWTLEPVPCVWHQCLDWLASGRIDLMPDLAMTQERSQQFAFHQTPALLSWSQLYEAAGIGMTSLLDLGGKRIAVLRGSVQQEYLQHLAESFDLEVTWLVVPSIEDGFQAVTRGKADAVATNHFIGDRMAQQLGLDATPILFQPSKIFFATAHGRLQPVLDTLDQYLVTWQADTASPYFQILRRWGVNGDKKAVPAVVWGIIAALIAALLLAMGLGQWLRRQVMVRTRRLQVVERRLNTILDSVEALIYIKDRDGRYQYANRRMCDSVGMTPGTILGRRDADFFDAESCAEIETNDRRVLEQGERVAGEERLTTHQHAGRRIYLSVKLPLRDENSTIYALCGISTDVTDYRQIQDQLHQLAFFDPLTGLPNRRQILDQVRQALAGDGRAEGALMLIDLNNFKSLNDTQGHEAGDQLLQQVAKRLERLLHSSDSAGRLGGDEFVLILRKLDPDARNATLYVRHMAQRILDQLAEPFSLGGVRHITSCCIGIALFSDTEGSAEVLMKNADLALAEAKASGRNTLRFFNPAMQTEVLRRTRIEAALRHAISTEEGLQLFVQPQIDHRQRYIGMEALLRWKHHVLGWVSPADFIPIAESSGLIIDLGHWVLNQACAILKRWHQQPALAALTLAVNISPRQFRHIDFINQVEQCLHQSGIDPSLLELEITESLLIDNPEQTILRMNHLRAHGIRFSLDDFGTGYASLGYLKRLPLYQLKIDQSFTRDLLSDSNDEAIVRTVIALGHSLDLRVIAEGVETQQQAQRLQELGCLHYQGYFFGRPGPVEEWEGKVGS